MFSKETKYIKNTVSFVLDFLAVLVIGCVYKNFRS